tara:strand:- start:1306 stop:2208 length:903 start_codon:yes stop_codon:yes gene_type:complete
MRKLIKYFGNFFIFVIGDFLLKKKSFFPELIENSYVCLDKISSTKAGLLKDEIGRMTMIEKNCEKNLVLKKNNLGVDVIDLDYYKKKEIVRIDVKQECLANSGLVSKFVTDPKWIKNVKKILGVEPCITGINAWFTFPPPVKINYDDDIGKFQSTMLWHRDADNLRDIKLMVYLTDVFSEKDGPFQIIEGTHKIKNFNFTDYFNKDLLRVRHDNVTKKYKHKTKSFFGKKGTNYIVDTRALHRGSLIEDGKHRLIFQIYFSIHPFGKAKKIPFPKPQTESYEIWNSAITKFPKNYKNLFV